MNNHKTIVKRWVIVAMGFVLMAIILFYYYFFSPETFHGLFPSCSFKSVTGLECVGCGGQRAVHELLNLNIIKAIDYNAFFVISIPLLMYYIFYSLRSYIYGIPTPNSFFYSPRFGLLFIILAILFTILRNCQVHASTWLNSVIAM